MVDTKAPFRASGRTRTAGVVENDGWTNGIAASLSTGRFTPRSLHHAGIRLVDARSGLR